MSEREERREKERKNEQTDVRFFCGRIFYHVCARIVYHLIVVVVTRRFRVRERPGHFQRYIKVFVCVFRERFLAINLGTRKNKICAKETLKKISDLIKKKTSDTNI